jgi:hypothetical protein
MPTKVDYLDEDPDLRGQAWFCVSFLSPEGIMNCNIRGLKVRGVYATRKEADERAKEISKFDSNFHVFVGQVGKWLPWDPDPESATDQVYREEKLQELMKNYKENMEKASEQHDKRHEDLVKRTKAEARDARKNAIKERLRAKLKKKDLARKMKDKVSEVYNESSVDNEKTKELTEKEQRLEDMKTLSSKEANRLKKAKETLNEKSKNVKEIDNKLNRINELYSKLKKKSASK